MLAKNIMVKELIVARQDELVSKVFDKMRKAKLRMLPVVDQNNCIVGILSTFCVMQHVIPSYVLSGDLEQLSFAPDIGVLKKHYTDIANQPISEVMNREPLLVQDNESVLSVAAALTAFGRHEYAMVVDHEKHLLGVISAGDILERLNKKTQEVIDA